MAPIQPVSASVIICSVCLCYVPVDIYPCFSVPLSSMIFLLLWPWLSSNSLGGRKLHRHTQCLSRGSPCVWPPRRVSGWVAQVCVTMSMCVRVCVHVCVCVCTCMCMCVQTERLTSSVASSDSIPFSLLHVHEHRENTRALLSPASPHWFLSCSSTSSPFSNQSIKHLDFISLQKTSKDSFVCFIVKHYSFNRFILS